MNKSVLSVILSSALLSASRSRPGSGNITSIESPSQLESVVRSGDGSSVRRIDITILSPESFEDVFQASSRFHNEKRKMEQLLKLGSDMFPNVEYLKIHVECKADERHNFVPPAYYSVYDYSEIIIPSELSLPNLSEVDIYDILVNNFDFLLNSPKVKKVDLAYCGGIKDWKPFLGMKNLESLNIDFVSLPNDRIPRELIANENLKKLFIYNAVIAESLYLPSNILSRTFDEFFLGSDDGFSPVFTDIDPKDMTKVIEKRYTGQLHKDQLEILEESGINLGSYLSPSLRRF